MAGHRWMPVVNSFHSLKYCSISLFLPLPQTISFPFSLYKNVKMWRSVQHPFKQQTACLKGLWMHCKAPVFLAYLDDTARSSKKDRYLHMSHIILNSLYFATCALLLLMLYSLYLFVFIKPAVLFSSLVPFLSNLCNGGRELGK
jgi:hypothetical protein